MSKRFKEVAEFLRESRTSAGLSQVEVSSALGYHSSQFVSNWERGIAAPPMFVVKKLAKLYGIQDEKLFRMILSDLESQMRKEFKRGSA